MLKFIVYIVFLVVIALYGLAIGSSNDTIVSFDFLMAKQDMSVSTVLAIGIAVGIVLGIYISLIFTFGIWKKAYSAKTQYKRTLKTQAQKLKEYQDLEKASEEAKS